MGGASALSAGVALTGQGLSQQPQKRWQPVVLCDATANIKGTKLYEAYTNKYGTSKSVQLTFSDIRNLLQEVGVKNDFIAGRIFFVMDADGSGTVDIKEMTAFCKKLAQGKPQEKAQFLFKACDLNSNNVIEKSEMRTMVKNLCLWCAAEVPSYSMISTERDAELYADLHGEVLAQVIANRIVADMFHTADTDKSGTISMKEFMFWVNRGGKNFVELIELFPVFNSLAQQG